MYGLTRGVTTLIAVAVAGGLIWFANWVGPRDSVADYWIAMALIAGAGLVMALSQLLGGWTKWGLPALSGNVLLLAFIPALIAGGWILVSAQPGTSEAKNRVIEWSGDAGISAIVADMTPIVGAIAFGLGLVFGLVFDTTGPRRRDAVDEGYVDEDGRRVYRDERAVAHARRGRHPEDEPVTAERGRRYDETDRRYDADAADRHREPMAVGSREDERATPSAQQPEPEPEPRRRSFFRR
jgi:hypothetical protein